MDKAPGGDRLEVADYGLSRNRNAVRDAKLVEALNEKFGATTGRKLFFNQIDAYNSLFSIEPSSFSPMNFAGTLEKIKNGTLTQNSDVSTADFDMEKVSALYARPEYKGRLRVEAGSTPCLSVKIQNKNRVIDEARRFVADWGG